MGYRGEDLDLRTPLASTGADLAGRVTSDYSGADLRYGAPARGGPIWVDETVLAACNHAYDIALAHRAAEVRLEHLLNALTRIDAAAETLEARGIRVMALRRETGALIASDGAAGIQNGKGTPRRSEGLEDVLRFAAASAERRSAPAGVDDVVRAVIELRPDLPGLRAYVSPPRYPATYPDPVPPFFRGGPSYEAADVPRVWPRSEPSGSPTDSVQNSRLDALEQMVRALSTDLESERKLFTGVLQELQREVMAQREDMSRHSGGSSDRLPPDITERIQSIEHAVMSARASGAVDLGPVLDRLISLERSLQSRPAVPADLGTIASRLEIIEEAVLANEPGALGKFADRLLALEGQVKTLATLIEREKSEASATLGPLASRLEALTAAVEGRNSEAETWVRSVEAKLSSFEQLLGDHVAKTDEVQSAHAVELKEVHDALVKLNSNQHTLAGSIGDWRTEGATEFAGLGQKLQSFGGALDGVTSTMGLMSHRVESLELEAAKPVAMLENVSATLEKMHKVTVERYHRRNRFWYWLFGTDDWVAASWPSQAARITDELKAVKTTARV